MTHFGSGIIFFFMAMFLRFAQHSIEGGIVTEHVETETLSLVFHRGANYWLAHLSGDCNIWIYKCIASSDCETCQTFGSSQPVCAACWFCISRLSAALLCRFVLLALQGCAPSSLLLALYFCFFDLPWHRPLLCASFCLGRFGCILYA